MNFGMIILSQNAHTMRKCTTCIQTVLLFLLRLTIFIKKLKMMLKKTFHTSNYESDRPLPTEKNKKVIRFMKDELGGNQDQLE